MAILTNTETSQAVLVAVEATEGTLGAGSWYRIPDAKITPGWQRTSRAYTPSTFKFPTIIVNGKEWVVLTLEAPIGYASQVFWLSSGANYAAPANGDPVTAKLWTFTPDVDGVNASKSFSIQGGNAANSWQVLGAHVVNMSWHLDREEPTFTAELVARRQTLGAALETIDATVENFVVAGASIDVLSYATFGATPTTLDHVYAVDLTMGNLYGQEWPLKSSLTSYGDRYETMPEGTMTVTALEQQTSNDLVGHPFSFADMRAGTINFFGVKSTGAVIGIGPDTYLWQADVAALIGDGPIERTIVDGLVVVNIPLLLAADPVSNKAIQFKVRNLQVDFVTA